MLLLNASRPTPLFSWRLRQDRIVSAQLLLGSAGSNAGEGVLGLTKRGELLLLSVLSGGGDRRVAAPGQQVRASLYMTCYIRCDIIVVAFEEVSVAL